MNIYRSSGRFAAVCAAARSDTPTGQQTNHINNGDLCPPPTPCPSIRDRQVLNRTPISTSKTQNQFYPLPSPRSPLPPISCQNLNSNSTVNHDENNNTKNPDEENIDDNDENSPIKSASYMDELRQRLERVVNNPPSPHPSSTSISSIPVERHSCLPVSKSFRLPIQPAPAQVQSSIGYRLPGPSRVPLKSTLSTSKTPLTKGSIRGPTLITPPKLKSTTNSQCLSSTENLRSAHQTIPAITIGSTPLPRKQLPSISVADRNLSYRSPSTTTNPYGHQYHFTNGNHHQQMSKSFIMPSKRDDHRSNSSLSVASKSDSLNLDDTDFPLTSPTFLDHISDTSTNIKPKSSLTSIKPKSTVMTSMNMNMNRSKLPSTTTTPSTSLKKPTTSFRTNNRPQPPIPAKSGLATPTLKLSSSVSQTRLTNKTIVPSPSINSLTNSKIIAPKPVPPVPPRKSSIPRPSFNSTKPQPPQRDSSSNLHLLKPHVSHL